MVFGEDLRAARFKLGVVFRCADNTLLIMLSGRWRTLSVEVIGSVKGVL